MGATHLLYHYQGRGRPIGGGAGVPTWNFDPALATFTAAMAKRTAPGPFATAPIVQGDLDGSGVPDILMYEDGTQISGHFYTAGDGYQGSIVMWITPEEDTATMANARYLTPGGVMFRISGNNLTVYSGRGATNLGAVNNLNWTAGSLYCFCASWDADNPISGANHVRITINDSHTFIRNTAFTPSMEDECYPGSLYDGTSQLNAIIEGLTVYRRVLSDGTYGDPATAGVDELLAIYAAGAGKKPEEVCPEDVVMAFPTNGVAGELATGDGEAWTFPWSDNELLNWHLQEDTAGAPDDWTAVNAPTLADAETANILFDTRAQKISVDAADEGIKQAKVVTPGEDFVTLAWLKAGGANQGVDLRIHDATHAADIVEMTTDVTGTWVSLNTCWEAPSGCVSAETFIESTDADTYSVYAQQVMVLPNLVANGGMEGTYVDGGVGGFLLVAPGFSQQSCEDDGSDLLSKDAGIFHSGVASQKVDVSAENEGITTDASVFAANKWYLVTVWLYATAGSVGIKAGGATFLSEVVTPGAAWTRYSWVVMADSSRVLYIRSANAAATFYVDDVSVIELDDLSITATAALEANSTENGGIRVDGLDTLYQASTGLTAVKGEINFTATKRHAAADVAKFGVTTPYEMYWYQDANNYIYVYWSAANTLTLTFNAQGAGVQTGNYNATGAWDAGASKACKVYYGPAQAILYVLGVAVVTIVQPASFTVVSGNIYLGSDRNGINQSDTVYS